jgi:hypothetical protein
MCDTDSHENRAIPPRIPARRIFFAIVAIV